MNKKTIKFAGRHILAVGSELIKDSQTALIELVKNSYDADATKVDIIFSSRKLLKESKKHNIIEIEIIDDGHGMSEDTINNKWLVTSTDDKLERKKSPNGRIMQGRKGLGRYSSSILGNICQLTTIHRCIPSKEDKDKCEICKTKLTNYPIKTDLELDWNEFNEAQYVENVEIEIGSKKTDLKNGTSIKITGNTEYLEKWNEIEITKLILDLRKMFSPIEEISNNLNVNLTFKDFFIQKFSNKTYNIKPIDVINLSDYKYQGEIKTYDINKVPKELIISREIELQIDKLKTQNKNEVIILRTKYSDDTYGDKINEKLIIKIFELDDNDKFKGEIKFDLRIFDREPKAIDNLIKKGLKDPLTGNYLTKKEARETISEYCGIGIFRNQVRINPYGNNNFDWLNLDKERIQNPSKYIGHNQVIGLINILSEESSGLEEKSARDGLKENEYYRGFFFLMKKSIEILSIERLLHRKATGKSRSKAKIGKELERFSTLEGLSKTIVKELQSFGISIDKIEKIQEVILKEEEQKSKDIQHIQDTIALYEGQATLGKIVNVIQHEGKKPISYFNSNCSRIEKYIGKLEPNVAKSEYLNDIVSMMHNMKLNSKALNELFNRLKPLSKRKNSAKEHFNLLKKITESKNIFNTILEENKIKVTIETNNEDLEILCWEEDIFYLMTNILDNSIYWLSNMKKEDDRKIEIKIKDFPNEVIIDIIDNGIGIKEEYCDSEIIFEPGYSTKSEGTGLGLAIAGESANRLNGELKVLKYEKGAYFRIEVDKK